VSIELRPASAGMAERVLIGSALFDAPKTVPKCRSLVAPEDFLSAPRRRVWRAILETYDRGCCDLVTVHDALVTAGELDIAGGADALAGLLQDCTSGEYAETYARQVRSAAIARQVQIVGARLLDADPENLANFVADARAELHTAILETEAGTTWTRQLSDACDDVLARQDREGHLVGIPTGFTVTDGLLSGLCPSDLILLAARPSIGKTAWALCAARNIAKAGTHVVFVSLEMSTRQILHRLLSTESGVPLSKLRGGGMSPVELDSFMQATNRLSQWPLSITDRAAMTVGEVRAFAEAAIKKHGKGPVIVDYLGLIRGRDGVENRNLEVAEVSRSLKAMAKDLDVPVLALSQLSRSPEKRADKRPGLSDLRDSGALEQDADVVLFLHRENIGADDAELVIGKHRNGPVGTVLLRYDGPRVSFSEVAAPEVFA
jgi:replicative DNA helicase